MIGKFLIAYALSTLLGWRQEYHISSQLIVAIDYQS
jgi:hypothetical protein